MAKISRQFASILAAFVMIAIVGITEWATTGHPWVPLVLLLALMFGIGVGELLVHVRSFGHVLRVGRHRP